jgi:hypothetical protein
MSGEGRCSPAERLRSSRTDVKAEEESQLSRAHWLVETKRVYTPKREGRHPLMHKEPYQFQSLDFHLTFHLPFPLISADPKAPLRWM